MKTSIISPELLAHYRSGSTTLALLWLVVSTSGLTLALTDHDVDIPYLGVIYRALGAFDSSAVSTMSGLNVGNSENRGLLTDAGITAEDIERANWDNASYELMELNWADTSMGHNPISSGALGILQRDDPSHVTELRNLLHKLQNNIGRITQPACDAKLGDERCGVDLEALRVSGTVESTTDARTFTDSSLTQDAGYFTYGEVTWGDGSGNEDRRMEIKQHSAGGVFVLQQKMPIPILPADNFTCTPGCDKTFATCKSKFNNGDRFNGFPTVPGEDQIIRVGN